MFRLQRVIVLGALVCLTIGEPCQGQAPKAARPAPRAQGRRFPCKIVNDLGTGIHVKVVGALPGAVYECHLRRGTEEGPRDGCRLLEGERVVIAWDDTTDEIYLIDTVKIDKPTILYLYRPKLAAGKTTTEGGRKGTVRTEELRP
jgi:hypothetical protein